MISVDLVRRLLRSSENRNCLALVVSTENITQNWYRGNDRSMLLSNCLFRCGAFTLTLALTLALSLTLNPGPLTLTLISNPDPNPSQAPPPCSSPTGAPTRAALASACCTRCARTSAYPYP